nr:MAG TPA: hypothetical protein [Caudoviricetes sp.]
MFVSFYSKVRKHRFRGKYLCLEEIRWGGVLYS